MTEMWQWFVSVVHTAADVVGPGPAVLLVAVTAGALVWVVGLAAILLTRR